MFRPWIFVPALAGCLDAADEPAFATSSHALVDASFVAQGLAGKCISVDPKGTRLVLATCRPGDPDQQIRIVEQPEDRQVELQMRGDQCIQPLSGIGVPGVALELAPCAHDKRPAAQEWILDGDSVRLAPVPGNAWPDLFISVHDHSGVDGSPLTLEPRRFDDSDYWELTSTSKEDLYPTSGFVRVGDRVSLETAFDQATPGTVIEIAEGADIQLFECDSNPTHEARLRLTDRVTLRGAGRHGGKRPTHPSARLHYDPYLFCLETENPKAIEVVGTGTRITNLYLEGRTVEKQDDDYPKIIGIQIVQIAPDAEGHCPKQPIWRDVEIDHLDLSGWKAGAVATWACSNRIDDNGTPPMLANGQWVGGNWTPLDSCRPEASLDERYSVVIAANYIHHNTAPLGYGVLVSGDGHAEIRGNTFLHNRHAIAAPGVSGVRYEATGNLVSSHGEDEQDFDVHGSANCGPLGASDHRGGVAGERIDIVSNTFLGDDRNNFFLRGTPCLGAEFARNVTRQQASDGYLERESTSQAARTTRCAWESPVPLDEHDNRYEIADPTAELVVGDFNGDGRDDVFMATGAAHYVSLDGHGAWQLRGYGTEQVADLRFGDFDGDGRTDILRDNPGAEGIQIRYGGEGDWVNKRPDVRVADLAVGDFNGDGRADLLWADGTTWRISFAGSALWAWSRPDTRRVADLRIGRIDAGPASDILVVQPSCDGGASCWAYFPSGTSSTALRLGPAQAPIKELAIADVDGDGRGDVIRSTRWIWYWKIEASLRGAEPLQAWAVSAQSKRGALGRFNSTTHDTALIWENLAWVSQQYGEPDPRYLAWFEMF